MKKLALTALLAGVLAATAGADEPRYASRHYSGQAAYEQSIRGDRRSARQPRHKPSYRYDDHRRDPGRHYPSYGYDQHERDRDRHDHDRHRHDRDDPTGEMLVGGLLGAFVGNALAGDGYGSQGTIFGAILGTAIGYGVGKD